MTIRTEREAELARGFLEEADLLIEECIAEDKIATANGYIKHKELVTLKLEEWYEKNNG